MKAMRWMISACITVSCGLGCATAPQAATRVIIVPGSGKVWAKPDVFVLDVDVIKTNDDMEEARRQASETSGLILAAIKPFALDMEESHTTAFTVRPDRVWDGHAWVARGFCASQNLRLHLTELAKAEDFVMAVLRTGVTSISTEFISREEEELWPKAREKALLDARERAEQMAAVLGQRLGPPLKIVDLDEETGSGIFVQAQSQQTADEDSTGRTFEDRLNWMPPTCVQVSSRVRVEFALESR